MELDYDNDIKIDEFALEEEWMKQADLYMRYSAAAASAQEDLARAHELLKVTRSKLIQECKSDFPKATGPEVEAFYRVHKDHISDKEAYIKAEFDYNILKGASDAMYMRRFALEYLVKLHLAGYYGEPKSPEDKPEFTTEVKKKSARGQIKKSMGGGRRTK